MNTRLYVSMLFFCVLASGSVAVAADKPDTKDGLRPAKLVDTPVVPPQGKGWIKLFNGKDFTGWTGSTQNGIAHWRVKDGVIDCDALKGRGPSLITEKTYGDYVLHIEWRFKGTAGKPYNAKDIQPDGSHKKDSDGKEISIPTDNADSGIFFRGTGQSQINLWCWPVGSGELWGYRKNKNVPASTRAGCVPKVKADKPVGHWNKFIITAKGETLSVVLNGKTVIDNVTLPGLPPTGKIVLQHHGGYNAKKKSWSSASSLVQFRNIWIKPLNKK